MHSFFSLSTKLIYGIRELLFLQTEHLVDILIFRIRFSLPMLTLLLVLPVQFFEDKKQLILKSIFSDKYLMYERRSIVENDYNKIQIVVCAYFEYDNKIAVFTKYETDTNQRFHEKKMIWVGGHLQNIDIENINESTPEKILANCLAREIYEELEMSLDITPVYKGVVYDKTNRKSYQHLGIVFKVKLKDDYQYKTLNNKRFTELSGQSINVQFVDLNLQAFSDVGINTIEPWSADILHNIHSLNIHPSDKQLVMF